jgi:hypothetical protein
MAPKIISLLDTHQILMVSGMHHDDFDKNTRIGKSHILMNELKPALEAKHILVGYENIATWGESFFKDYIFEAQARTIRHADVLIFDEIHTILLTKNGVSPFEIQATQRRHNDIFMDFWINLRKSISRGQKVIFCSALHPLNKYYSAFLYNKTIYSVLISPVVELDAYTRRDICAR